MASRRSEALLFVPLAALHGLAVWCLPSAPVVALLLFWNAQTVSHNFIHRPFFGRTWQRSGASAALTLLLGFPQSVWRARHLAHHAGAPARLRWEAQLGLEGALLVLLWAALAATAPGFLLTAYLPGVLGGLGLCAVHGHHEHARGAVSHRGWLYNLLFFNDGYHAEHHAHPGAAFWTLPARRIAAAPSSRWPAFLRWLEGSPLDWLERGVLTCRPLQRFLLRGHGRAMEALLAELPPPRSVAIVGGGLFPRTALILQRLLPRAKLIVIDARPDHLARAARFLRPERVELRAEWYDPRRLQGVDLAVFPLAFQGDREDVERAPPAPAVLMHDWLWRRRGAGVVVSRLLLKRLNLLTAPVHRARPADRAGRPDAGVA